MAARGGKKDDKPAEGAVVIPGEARDVTPADEDTGPEDPPTSAVAIAEPQTPTRGHVAVGVGALAAMSDVEFERNLGMLKKGVERAKRVKLEIMEEGEDYGLIPGTKTPTLLKPGAEKLALAYGLVSSFEHHIKYGNNETAPPILVVVDCFLHLGSTDGPVIAQGMGASSSWEKRYRYRGDKGRVCPSCGVAAVIRSPRDRDLPLERQGWWCGPREGGCGNGFKPDVEELTSQPDPGKAENADPHELLNTLLKMAEKRANVDAVLRGTASSGLFTQDMDDDEGDGMPGSGRAGGDAGNGRQSPGNGPRSDGAPRGGGQGQSGGGGAPGPPDGPPELTMVVAEQPDSGVRMVKDSHKELRWEGTRAKLEVIGKLGNRKHTAIILGPLAEAAVAAAIQLDEPLRLVNVVVEEITWQEGKPTRKEVWGPAPTYLMDDVMVGRGGDWVSVKTFAPALWPEPSSSEPPAATAGSGSPPSAEPSSPASPPASSPAAEDSAPTTSASPSTPAATSTATASDSDKAEPQPRKTGDPGEYTAIVGTLNDPVRRTMKGATLVAVLRLSLPETGELVLVGLTDDIDGQLGTEEDPWLAPGDKVDVFGMWSPNGWVIAETVGKHREGGS